MLAAAVRCVCVMALVLLAQPARADVITPDVGACQGKAKGDACDDEGKKGVCTASTCSRRDYSQGPPGEVVNVDCLRCVPATPPPAGDRTGAVPSAPPSTPPKSASKGTGCSAGGATTLGSLGLGAALLALARRRRS